MCLATALLQTAATLHDQTQQLNKIVDDLNEIEFTMKKASKVIADIGKGIMTDRCAGSGWVGSGWSAVQHKPLHAATRRRTE
jgi:hypothetical protein